MTKYPNWYELRSLDSVEEVAPKPVWEAFLAICEAEGDRPLWVAYDTRKGILKALGDLWERSATEEEIDKLHSDTTTYWESPNEQRLRAKAEEEEKARKAEEARIRAWHERIMQKKEREWARERAEAEKKGRKK